MADSNRMRIIISAENKEANAAFSATNQQLDVLSQHAVKIAQSISSHFQAMANEIRQAIQGLNGAFGGLDASTKRIVDQFGRPIATQTAPVAAATGGAVAGGAAAGAYARWSQDLLKQAADSNRAFDNLLEKMRKHMDAVEALESSSNPISRGWNQVREYRARRQRDAALRDADTASAGYNEQLKALNLSDDELEAFSKAAADATGKQASFAESARKSGQELMGAMLQAQIFYTVLDRGARTIKTVTIDTTLYAARVEQLQRALATVATTNGITPSTAVSTAEAIRRKGVTTEESYASVTQMMAAQMPIEKAGPLAEIAQNIGRVRGIPTADVMQGLTNGIITARTEQLHFLGIMVNAEIEYRKYAATIGTTADKLTQYQRNQALTNAVIREGAGYAGAYKDSLDTLGGKLASMLRLIAEAKLAVGKGFQGEAGIVVGAEEKILKKTAENPEAAAWALRAGAMALGALLLKIPNPYAKIAGGIMLVVSSLDVLYKSIDWGIDKFKAFWAAAHPNDPAAGIRALMQEMDKLLRQNLALKTHETTAPAKSLMDDLEASMKERDAAMRRLRPDYSKMSPKEMAELAIQNQIRQVQADTEWYQKSPERLRQSQRTLEESTTAGLEGAYATRAKAEAQIREQGLDKVGFQRGLEPQAAANYRAAAGNEIRGQQLKMERDLTISIKQEQANLLEGWDKIAADGDIEIEKLKQQGYATDKLVKLQHDLTQAKGETAAKEAERQARDAAARAAIDEKEGYARITAEIQYQIEELTRKNQLTGKTIDYLREQERIQKRILDRQNQDEIDRMHQESVRGGMAAELDAISEAREARLASLETTFTFDLKSKIAVEKEKFAVELEYLHLIEAKKKEMREQDYNATLEDLNKRLYRGEITQQQYDAMRKERRGQLQTDINRISEQGETQQDQILKRHNAEVRRMIQEDYQQLYDRLKQFGGSLFDTLTDKSHSFLENIGNMLRKVFMDLMKAIFESQFAKMMTQLLTGVQVQNGSRSNNYRGIFGSIGNVLGDLGINNQPRFALPAGSPDAVPFTRINLPNQGSADRTVDDARYVQAVGAQAGEPGGLFSGADPNNPYVMHATGGSGSPIYAMPGMVGVMTDGKGSVYTSAAAKKGLQLQGGFGGKYGSTLNGLATMIGLGMALNGLNQKGASGTVNRGLGGALAAWGIAGGQLGVLGSAGVGLAYDGIVRGGWAGMGEAAGGGAMIGLQFGGPLGAAIGGIAGFAAAGLRTLFGGQSPEDKLHDRIKSITGVDVKQKSILTDWLKMLPGTTTPMMDVWIRSRQGQELIEAYSQSVGGKFHSKYNVPQFAMIGAGGSLYEATPYLNGSPMPSQSALPSLTSGINLDQIGAGLASAPTVINFSMPAEAVNEAFNGRTIQVIANNPRVVQAAANKSTSSSYGRTQQQINTTSPLSIRS